MSKLLHIFGMIDRSIPAACHTVIKERGRSLIGLAGPGTVTAQMGFQQTLRPSRSRPDHTSFEHKLMRHKLRVADP